MNFSSATIGPRTVIETLLPADVFNNEDWLVSTAAAGALDVPEKNTTRANETSAVIAIMITTTTRTTGRMRDVL